MSERSATPKELQDCFVELNKLLATGDRASFLSKREEDLCRDYHLGLGMILRNEWGLWQNSRLARFFEDLGVDDPDTMSEIILRSYWRNQKGVDIKFAEQVAEITGR